MEMLAQAAKELEIWKNQARKHKRIYENKFIHRLLSFIVILFGTRFFRLRIKLTDSNGLCDISEKKRIIDIFPTSGEAEVCSTTCTGRTIVSLSSIRIS